MADFDTASIADAERESHLVGCSIKGPDHEHEDQPCQDNWDGMQLSNSRFVLAVADGLGSASHSDIGSKIASETVVEHLKDSISGGGFDKTSLKDALKSAFRSARSALRDEADRQDVSVSDLNTTTLAAAGGPSGAAAAAVGDGGIIRVYRDQFRLFIPREKSEYANRTTPIQSDHWEESYRFEYTEEVDGVAAFSDGLENFAWDGRDEPQRALFEQLFTMIWYTTDTDRIEDELIEFFDHERFRSVSGDDKTIAIATLDVDYEGRVPLSDENESGGSESSQETSSSNEPASDETESTVETREAKHDGENPDETSVASSTGLNRRTCTNSGTRLSDTPASQALEAKKSLSNEGNQADGYEGEEAMTEEKPVTLENHIYSDQTGAVYNIRNSSMKVKIFDRNKRDESRKKKLTAMIQNQPNNLHRLRKREAAFQWPSAILKDRPEETFLGYAFTASDPIRTESQPIEEFARNGELNQGILSRLNSSFRNRRREYAGKGTSRYATAIDLATVVKKLHEQDIAICDFSPQDIYVTDSELLFTSCDRYALDDGSHYYAESSHHAEYTPNTRENNSIQQSQYMDRLGLAVQLYRLLLRGDHPFIKNGSPGSEDSPLESIQPKPHISTDLRKVDVGSLENPEQAKRYDDLPQIIRYHFDRCFMKDKGFDTPKNRPSARRWVKILTEIEGD